MSRNSPSIASAKPALLRQTTKTRSKHVPTIFPMTSPSKATITIKEINDNRYYYWQWRDGDKTRSQYEGPVNPDE